jgi:hypothetical protein
MARKGIWTPTRSQQPCQILTAISPDEWPYVGAEGLRPHPFGPRTPTQRHNADSRTQRNNAFGTSHLLFLRNCPECALAQAMPAALLHKNGFASRHSTFYWGRHALPPVSPSVRKHGLQLLM